MSATARWSRRTGATSPSGCRARATTLSRTPPRRRDARVLAMPRVTKGAVISKLCTTQGLVGDTAARRDRDAYRQRKSWRWGDGVTF